jgi:AAA15 family ATPase/GTPase
VQSEWLFTNDGAGEQPLFEREQAGDGSERPAITLGPALTQDEARRQFIAFVAEGTRPNQLFLTECAERNVDELGAVTRWLRSKAIVTRPSPIDFMPELLLRDDHAFREYLGNLLRSAGTGVSGVSVEPQEEEDRFTELFEKESFERGLMEEFARGFRRLPKDVTIKLHHLSPTGTLVPFSVREESDGTRRLANLAPVLFDLQQPPNGAPSVHLVDELDRSLHPLLTRFFLDTFLHSCSAEHPGQILFTTHDTNLLDLTLLTRDSIWFTEKDAGGSSSLYSLAEFKGEQLERLGEHLEEGYLNGRFGAIPFLGDARRLGWTKASDG